MHGLDPETIDGDYKEGLQVWKKIFDNLFVPELCECGRLYKDSIDETGKITCPLCFSDLNVEHLKLLWATPRPKKIKDVFVQEFCLHCKNELIACVC